MRRFAIVIGSLVIFAVAIGCFFYAANETDQYGGHLLNWWRLIVVPFALLTLAFFVGIYGATGDVYHIHSGRVTKHSFEAFDPTPQTAAVGASSESSAGAASFVVPGQQIHGTWSILVEDENGHTKWFPFSSDVFDMHPIGSRYSDK